MLSQLKKILISLSPSLLSEVDEIIADEKTNRSKFVREAIHNYVKEKKRLKIKEQMINGYKEMWDINLSIAQEWSSVDFEQYICYEEKLSECE